MKVLTQSNYLAGKLLNLFVLHLAAMSIPLVNRILPRGKFWLYDIKRSIEGGNSTIIFDVGANIGQTAHDIAIFFPKANVYCFEPVADTFRLLALAYGSRATFTLVQQALGSSPGRQEIPLHDNPELNTLVKNQPRTNDLKGLKEEIVIETLDRFSEVNSIDHIDVLKMDVQGWELEVLRGAQRMIARQRIRFILAEVGFRRGDSDMQYFEDLNSFLESRGCWLCGFYDQFRWGPTKQFVGFANALYALR